MTGMQTYAIHILQSFCATRNITAKFSLANCEILYCGVKRIANGNRKNVFEDKEKFGREQSRAPAYACRCECTVFIRSQDINGMNRPELNFCCVYTHSHRLIFSEAPNSFREIDGSRSEFRENFKSFLTTIGIHIFSKVFLQIARTCIDCSAKICDGYFGLFHVCSIPLPTKTTKRHV